MRCSNKKCNNITRTPTSSKCWREWGLCGPCAIVQHPDEYQRYMKKFGHTVDIRHRESGKERIWKGTTTVPH